MSIFGKLDAATIPSNPFYVKEGEYVAEVTAARYQEGRDGRQLYLEFTIKDSSEYNGSKVTKYFDLPAEDMTAEQFELMPDDEKAKMRRNNSLVKNILCGRSEKLKGLGVPVDDLNDENWKPDVVVGTPVNMAISNFGEDGVNFKWANIITE
jgi:hypothetical protein